MVAISIIIPVYNAERFIDRCLNSILSQTFTDYEIIIVDDGSTDDSLKICKSYSEKNNNIIVVHQENKGPSDARNNALDRVTGKYLCFVDADDEFSSDEALYILNNCMDNTKADMCIFPWIRIEENGKVDEYKFSDDEKRTDPSELIKVLMQGNYKGGGGNPWNKIWRIDSIKKQKYIHKFDSQIQIYEDMLWVIQGLEQINKIVYVDVPLYKYYIINSSLSRNGAILDRKKKYAEGARAVYDYINKNCRFAEKEAVLWYKERLSNYLIEKVKSRVNFTEEEKNMIKKYSLNPHLYSSFYMWRRILIIKVATLFL